jgi:hypothetical protein
MEKKPNQVWKEYCTKCARNHFVTNKPCPSCGINHTPQPVSEKVAEQHISSKYDCDGCEAYQDHLR